MGKPRCYERQCRFLCFLLPVGGAKLLEEETESRVKRPGVIRLKLKNLLVSWQFLFRGSFSSLVLASFKFQK